jgi:hypothetical protein
VEGIGISASITRFNDVWRFQQRLPDERHENEEECEGIVYEEKQGWYMTGD